MKNMNTLPDASEKCEMVLYQPDESIRLEVRLDGETVWLTQAQIAELFGTKRPAITKHLSNIFKSGELDEDSSCSILEHMGNDGVQVYRTKYYNLDAILSVGYRVNSANATVFRRWATQVLKQFMLRGYSVNQHLVALQERVDNRLVAIETELADQRQKVDFLIERDRPVTEQLFSTGCVWDAYAFVSDLVRAARERLVLVDPFVDDRTLLLLDKRADGVECTVYTRYKEQVELDFQKHNQQCAPIGKVQLPHAVHDRYLIVDEQVWLLGASVKDMGRGLCTVIQLGFLPEDVLGKL